MTASEFWIGQSVELRASFSVAGASVAVGGVQFKVRKPDGQVATVSAAEGAGGVWVGYVVADQSGAWTYRAECTTPRPAADEGGFRVRATTVS